MKVVEIEWSNDIVGVATLQDGTLCDFVLEKDYDDTMLPNSGYLECDIAIAQYIEEF